jgi:membrane-associated protein
MDFLHTVTDFIFHIDKHLDAIIGHFGAGTYLLLFAIVFAETGLIVTPFLPGDSLLFAVGVFAGCGDLSVLLVFVLLSLAAVIGDSVNYAAGKYFGEKIFTERKSRFFKEEYLDKTHRFYEKYGAKTIVIARFVPIVRTFAPFVAGAGQMRYLYFFTYNVLGGVLWVALFVFGGYFFGNIPFIKNNFSAVILFIIAVSILLPLLEIVKAKKGKGSVAAGDGLSLRRQEAEL